MLRTPVLGESFCGEAGCLCSEWKNLRSNKSCKGLWVGFLSSYSVPSQQVQTVLFLHRATLLWFVLSLSRIFVFLNDCFALCLPHSEVFGWPRDPSKLYLIKQHCITVKWVHHVTLFSGAHKTKTKPRSVIPWMWPQVNFLMDFTAECGVFWFSH